MSDRPDILDSAGRPLPKRDAGFGRWPDEKRESDPAKWDERRIRQLQDHFAAYIEGDYGQKEKP